MLKPKGVKAVTITLTEIKPNKQFTDCTSFPGTKMYNTHTVEETRRGRASFQCTHCDWPTEMAMDQACGAKCS